MTFDTDPTQPRPRRREASRSSAASARTSRHIFIAAARSLGIPARYVGGYFHRADGVEPSRMPAMPGPRPMCRELGWVAFDPRQRHLRDRRACAGRGRARLSRRRPGARHALRRRRRERWRSQVLVDQAAQQAQS